MSIADNPSSLALTTSLFMPKRDSQMNPNAALLADRQGKQSGAVEEIEGDTDQVHARCILQSAQTVARTLLYLSCLVETAPCTAATASAREGLAHEQAGKQPVN